jgi:hypothetical protein
MEDTTLRGSIYVFYQKFTIYEETGRWGDGEMRRWEEYS